MESIVPDIFDLKDSESWLDYLDTNGYVVIQNILEKNDYDDIFQTFKSEWNELSPEFDFEKKSTWKMENIEPLHSGWYYGMVNGHGFGQSDFQWKLRTHPNILSIWEQVHKTKELVVSFDGLSLFISKTQEGIMYHTDQHPKDDLYSVQGAYNFLKVGLVDSGFVVVPRSHKTFQTHYSSDYKFIVVDEEDPHLLDAVHLQIPENCFILWNSKTIHSSIGMETEKHCFNRLTSYLCYFPKSLRDETTKQQRIQGYYNGDNCSHYAIHHQVKGNPQNQKKLKPTLENGKIPENRMALI